MDNFMQVYVSGFLGVCLMIIGVAISFIARKVGEPVFWIGVIFLVVALGYAISGSS